FERLGSSRTIKVDVRVIAATNRNLLRMVQEERFRDDLYYRLNVFPIYVPPLRERPEDIPALVRHFVDRFARRMNRSIEVIPNEVIETMQRCAWPGNVRELANLIERAVILSAGPTLDVPIAELGQSGSLVARRNGTVTLAQIERARIVAVLEEANWLIAGPRGAAALRSSPALTSSSKGPKRARPIGCTCPVRRPAAEESLSPTRAIHERFQHVGSSRLVQQRFRRHALIEAASAPNNRRQPRSASMRRHPGLPERASHAARTGID